jgi:uncharacterized membrane protein
MLSIDKHFFPYILVAVSAFTHAYWNFLLKKAGGSQVFIGLSKLSEIILFGIPFFIFAAKYSETILRYWPLAVIGALFVLLNYLFLGQAYRAGDLSLVYPISRAGALLFLPVLAYAFINERLDLVGAFSILLIITGIFVLQLQSFHFPEILQGLTHLRSKANLFALLAAFTVACYTLWDKNALLFLPAFIYFYLYTTLAGIIYGLYIFVQYPRPAIHEEWAAHKYEILQVGFFNTLTYLLVLFALQSGKASYVIAVRQLSIVIGVLLGWKFLQETLPLPKQVGVMLLLVGCIIVGIAR